MEVKFTLDALEDIDYWKQKRNDKIIARINELIKAIQTDPFRGIGKPEPLKHKYSGKSLIVNIGSYTKFLPEL